MNEGHLRKAVCRHVGMTDIHFIQVAVGCTSRWEKICLIKEWNKKKLSPVT